MGLSKEIRMPNGVVLGYHRIVVLTQHVNVATILEVQSYLNESERIREQEAYAANKEAGEVVIEANVYIEGNFFNLEYDPEMTVAKAYAYLKTLGDYEDAEDVIDKWAAGTAYYTGDLVMYEEEQYECIQPHTSQEGWEPPNAPALWKRHSPGGEVPEWVQPAGAQDAYAKGDVVAHNGKTWTSDVDGNVWEPGVYGWSEGGE